MSRDVAAEERLDEAFDRLRAMIGQSGPEVRGSVTARDIARFGLASGDPSFVHADASDLEEATSPPLLLSSVIEWQAGPRLDELRADGTGVGRESWMPLDGLRLMGGGQDLEFRRPVAVGCEFSARPVLSGVERKQGRSGPMLVLTITTESRDVSGDVLQVCRETLIAR